MSVNVIPPAEGATSTGRGRATFGRQRLDKGATAALPPVFQAVSYRLTREWWRRISRFG